ncbi:iron ABC transporter [Carbonactinospora thermoautotrophica]|uniref:FecCD family ABC transporter permease n=1 Tax=Carbonactinospora thermoautotrophica TaxID=1469144 RepID=UPI00226E5114|nr:iron ABC transporter permease [Carbonactinospora thermoautotrophica]MCX9192219.1 iron ABC transporter [Carbonactinospora thermoautotrophica]
MVRRLAAAAVLLVAAGAAQLLAGRGLGPGEVWAALASQETDPTTRHIVWELRVPRVLVSLAAGACLGVSGLLLQAALRNPLAAPEVTGIGSGAVLGAVAGLHFGWVEGLSPFSVVLAACAGGVLGGGLLWLLTGAGHAEPAWLAVYGVLTSAALSGVTALLLVLDPDRIGGALVWLIGSVNGRAWLHWHLIWPWGLAWLTLAWLLSAVANVLQCGDDQAAVLGLPPGRARLAVLGCAVALAAGAVAVVGAVGFLGLLVPHLARTLAGADLRRAVPLCATAGAVALSAADTIAQLVTRVAPWTPAGERFAMPAGAVTALAGALLLVLFARRGREFDPGCSR